MKTEFASLAGVSVADRRVDSTLTAYPYAQAHAKRSTSNSGLGVHQHLLDALLKLQKPKHSIDLRSLPQRVRDCATPAGRDSAEFFRSDPVPNRSQAYHSWFTRRASFIGYSNSDNIDYRGSSRVDSSKSIHCIDRECSSIDQLIRRIDDYETDRRSANIAAAVAEDCQVSEQDRIKLERCLSAYIQKVSARNSRGERVSLQCAIRKYVFLLEPGEYAKLQWLLGVLPIEDGDTRIEATKAIVDFLCFEPPPFAVDAPSLQEYFSNCCERFFAPEPFAFVQCRVLAFQSLLGLTLLGCTELSLRFANQAAAISDGTAAAVVRRAEDLFQSLVRRSVGSKETRSTLLSILNRDGHFYASPKD